MKHFEKTITIQKEKIYTQSWSPEEPPRALLFVLHGVAEHSGRYLHVAEKLVSQGIAVYTMDLPGHGKSSGKRAYIKSFDYAVGIVDYQIRKMKLEFPATPAFFLGHSMGGSLAVFYALKLSPALEGFILTSSALKISSDISPLLVKLSGFFSLIAPKMPVLKLDSQGLSRDPKVIREYNSDPLNFLGKLPVRTGAEINRSISFTMENAGRFNYPVLILHGSEDKLADYRGSETFFQKISSKDKEMKIFDSLYHELLNEYEKEEIIGLISHWILKRAR
ncbi:MAG: lysophospholipase [Candidatus Marinimicrobia bacterium]|nr:lysophospholipase [Candidatus Neomarinimicrobiota bacterium]